MKTLLIDDRRTLSLANATARSFKTGVNKLKRQKWDLLLLDHDLGEFEKTGYDVMVWLKDNKEFQPKMILCISNNPPGRDRINLMIKDIYGRVFDSRDIDALKDAEERKEKV